MPIMHTNTKPIIRRTTPRSVRGQMDLLDANTGRSPELSGGGGEEAREGGKARTGVGGSCGVEASEVCVRLGYPISTNRYWRTFRGMTVVSKEAKAYKHEAALLAKLAGICRPHEGRVSLRVTLLPKTTKNGAESAVRMDIDNVLKVAIDALNKVAYLDDRQIIRIVAELGEAVPGGGLLVCVKGE